MGLLFASTCNGLEYCTPSTKFCVRHAPTMATLEVAVHAVLGAIHSLPTELCSLATAGANKRTLATAVIATRAVPPFAASIKDGYAVRAEDCTRGTALRRIAGRHASRAGSRSAIPMLPLHAAVYITTGAPLPQGTNSNAIAEPCAFDYQ